LVLGGYLVFKKVLFRVSGIAVVFVIGSVIMAPINVWYADKYLGGEDHIGRIARFNMLIVWPTLLMAGFFLGNYIHKRYMALQSRGKKGPGL
jgi:hypothetical protein